MYGNNGKYKDNDERENRDTGDERGAGDKVDGGEEADGRETRGGEVEIWGVGAWRMTRWQGTSYPWRGIYLTPDLGRLYPFEIAG